MTDGEQQRSKAVVGSEAGASLGVPEPSHVTVAWQSRDFRFYSAARVIGIMGAEAQAVGVAWQVYQLTHSALALGYTGLALFLPGLFFVLPAGHVADRYDRRTVIMICYTLQAVATALLLWLTLHGLQNIWVVYGILFLIGTGRCFSGPAASALVPTLVPKEHFVNAVTWGATIYQIANATGPMIGGLLFTVSLVKLFGGRFAALNGAPLVYCFTLFGLLSFLLFMSLVKPRGAGEKKAFTFETMVAGLKYVASTRLLLGSISLDLFAVLLGGAVSLMPIFASDVLHSGANGLGLLRAMPSLGALVVSMLLLVVPIKRRAGRTMLTCVAIFGAATVVFGISRNIWLSCAALVVIGASDMTSVVIRSSILQLATPPEMRGRVSSVNWLFIGASNELGEYESGLTAHWWGAVRAVIVGGMASLMVTGLWSVFFPALRKADKLSAEDLVAVEKQFASMEPVG
jgi:MFS family permease